MNEAHKLKKDEVIDLVMSSGGYNVKIAGTSRGCKANSIEKRASGQERVDRDE